MAVYRDLKKKKEIHIQVFINQIIKGILSLILVIIFLQIFFTRSTLRHKLTLIIELKVKSPSIPFYFHENASRT